MGVCQKMFNWFKKKGGFPLVTPAYSAEQAKKEYVVGLAERKTRELKQKQEDRAKLLIDIAHSIRCGVDCHRKTWLSEKDTEYLRGKGFTVKRDGQFVEISGRAEDIK